MSLANRCRYDFDMNSVRRGQDYFRRGAVEIKNAYRDSVEAHVRGSRPTPYDVEIDWSEHETGRILANCSCPHFHDGWLCKHVWATLLKIDAAGFAGHIASSRRRRWRVLPAYDDSWSDDGDGDEDSWDDEDEEFEVDFDGEDEDEDDFDGEDEDDFDDDQEDFDDELDERFDEQGLRFSSSARASRARSRPQSRTDARMVWRAAMARIADAARQQPNDFATRPSLPARPREAWYVINVRASTASDRLIIDLRQREAGRNGALGKIKKLSLRREQIASFSNSEDQALLPCLMGNELVDESGSRLSYTYRYLSFSRVAVPVGMYDFLLPRLCATGRCVWLLDDSLPIDEARHINWDDGPAWRLRLQVQPNDADQQWQISGQLVRADQVLPLEQAVLILRSGLALFPDRMARVESAEHFGWLDHLRARSSLAIPYCDRTELLQALFRLPKLPDVEWPDNLQVERVQGEVEGCIQIRTPKRHYYSKTSLLANVLFRYGECQFGWRDTASGRFDHEGNRVLLRDFEGEARLRRQLDELQLRPSGPSYGDEHDLEFPPKRLPEIVAALSKQGWTVEAEGVVIRRPGQVHLSVTTGIDWFELEGGVDFDGVSVSLPALLKAVRANERFIRLADGSHGMLPEEWLARYGHLAELADVEGDTLRFTSSQALLLDALLAEQENVRTDEGFQRFRQKLRSLSGVKPRGEPRGFRGQLRPYQQEGLGWLHFLCEFGFGGCLADDMGLGKTIQVLALLQARRTRRLNQNQSRLPSLVVVPKSLVFNWVDEAARFTPRLRVLNYTGLDRKERLATSGEYDLLVTTYGTLRRDIVTLKDMRFDYAILDESQAIKNHHSQAAKASRLLHADHRLAMTGTPVENHLGELWSLFEFLNPGMLGRSSAFEAFAKNGRNNDKGSLTMLAQALRPFLLRRNKEQVLTELPEKIEQTLFCELPPGQRKRYDELRDYYRTHLSERVEELGFEKAKIHVLEALLRLRQAACHQGLLDRTKIGEPSAKLDVLLEQLAEVMDEGHKALVFSQFTSLLAIVRHHLDKRQIVYEYLDGSTRKRGERVKRFQEDRSCPLFLISLKAGGQGLNLTAADYVFILDPWWNPAVEAQAVDRAHRIGQTHRVIAYRLIAQDTVEQKILELQKTKRALADAIISADNSLIRTLCADDLELLFS